jgi:hypothetical protein
VFWGLHYRYRATTEDGWEPEKTIQRYENDYNLKSIVFLQWHKANSQAVKSENKGDRLL